MHIVSGPTLLRRLTPEDVDPFLAYRTDPEVAKYQSWDVQSREDTLGFLSHMQTITPLMRPGHWVQIAVATTKDNILIGDMGWHLSENSQEIEMGITLARGAQKQGHALRAVEAARDTLFEITPAVKINAFADLRNLPSRTLMQRAGFTSLGEQVYEGVKEEAFEFLRPSSTL